jgi:hypothetical protein
MRSASEGFGRGWNLLRSDLNNQRQYFWGTEVTNLNEWSDDEDKNLSPNDVRLNNGEVVSWQAFQHIYATISGTHESLSKRINAPFHVTLEDLDDLNSRIHQIVGPFTQKKIIERITCYYTDGNRLECSSFFKFKEQAPSTNRILENVRFEYRIIATIGDERIVKEFKVHIDVQSRVGAHIRDTKEREDIPPFLMFLSKTTGYVEIEHSEYSAAKILLDCVDQWFSSLHTARSRPIVDFALRNSESIAIASRILAYLVLGAVTSHYLSNNYLTIKTPMISIIAILICCTFAFSALSFKMQMMIEKAIRSIGVFSYVNISKGDSKAIGEFRSSQNRSATKAALNLASQIITAYATGKIIMLLP